jgi:hypothetical protein
VRADDVAGRRALLRRYRREEMKIQVWENRRRQKAELQMKTTEVLSMIIAAGYMF